MMDVVPSSIWKSAEPAQALVRALPLTWRLSQLWADLLASLQQVSEQTWAEAEAEAAAVKSIHMQRGLEESLSGLMWDGSG